jgi:ATPase family associated with various cellular activities (AAA)
MTTSSFAKAGLFDVDSFTETPTTIDEHNNATDQRFHDRQALILEGRRVPTARELLRGSIFFTGNIDADMKRVASLLLRRYGRLSIMHQAYDQLFRLLGKMVDRPSRDYLGPLYGAMKHLTAVCERHNWPLHPDHLVRVKFYLASNCHRELQLEISAKCWSLIGSERSPSENRMLLARAIGWQFPEASALERGDKNKMPPSPSDVFLAGEIAAAKLTRMAGWKVIVDLFRLDGYRNDWSSHGKMDEVDIDSLSGQVEKSPVSTDARGRREESSEAETVVPPGPGVVVFPSFLETPDQKGREVKAAMAHVLGKAIPLIQPPDLKVAREVILSEFPHIEYITDSIFRDIAVQRTGDGRAYIGFRPLLLNGEPGSGKSRYAQRLGEILGLKQMLFSCTGLSDGMFASTSRKWSNGMMSTPAQFIMQSMIANPLIILDELEKVGTGKQNGSLVDVLLSMLERNTAAKIHDQYLIAEIDLSKICWIATTNSLGGLPKPLMDRFRVIQFPTPAAKHLEAIGASLLTDVMASQGFDARWVMPLTGDEITALKTHWQGGSIRSLRRLIEGVVATRDHVSASKVH